MPNYIEKNCKLHGLSKFVLEGRGYSRCVLCRSDAVQRSRKKRKQKLVSIFGGKCVICGYDKCIDALEFHHKDPSVKEFGIASKGITRSFESCLKEANKCVLVCANCHREIEAGQTPCPN